jgi:hypothetical protein
MRGWVLAALIVGSGPQTFGFEGHQVAVGTLFIHATDAQSVTITRNGSVLAAFTFPKGTIMMTTEILSVSAAGATSSTGALNCVRCRPVTRQWQNGPVQGRQQSY